MTWKQPALLWLLLALGGLIVLYLSTLRRVPARGTVRFPLWIVAEAATHASRIRRHLPAAVFMLAAAAALAGAAGPIVPWPTPTGWPVVLIIDISRSMEETDIPPSRIEATKTAALEFVGRLPRSTRSRWSASETTPRLSFRSPLTAHGCRMGSATSPPDCARSSALD